MLSALIWQQWCMTTMQPPAIHWPILRLCLGESVSASLCWHTSVEVWFQWCMSHSNSDCHFVVPILSTIFFLWHPTSPSFIVCQYSCQWASALCLVWLHSDQHFRGHMHLLLLYPHHCFGHQVLRGQKQNVLYLCLPPHSRRLVLWNTPVYVLTSRGQLLPRHG